MKSPALNSLNQGVTSFKDFLGLQFSKPLVNGHYQEYCAALRQLRPAAHSYRYHSSVWEGTLKTEARELMYRHWSVHQVLTSQHADSNWWFLDKIIQFLNYLETGISSEFLEECSAIDKLSAHEAMEYLETGSS